MDVKTEFYAAVMRVKAAIEKKSGTYWTDDIDWETFWLEIAHFTYQRYAGPFRKHHGCEHIIIGINTLGDLTEDDPITLLSWLFHDVVYVMGTLPGVNEITSAETMRTMMRDKVSLWVIEASHQMIIATWKHEVPDDFVGNRQHLEWMLDFDLETLGVEFELFERYRKNIEFEASPLIPSLLTQAQFDENTKRFAESMLAKERIYLTPEFAHLEQPARENLSTLL